MRVFCVLAFLLKEVRIWPLVRPMALPNPEECGDSLFAPPGNVFKFPPRKGNEEEHLPGPVMRFFTADWPAIASGIRYLKAIGPGFFRAFIQVYGVGLRVTVKAFISLIAPIISTVVNVCLNRAMIFGHPGFLRETCLSPAPSCSCSPPAFRWSAMNSSGR